MFPSAQGLPRLIARVRMQLTRVADMFPSAQGLPPRRRTPSSAAPISEVADMFPSAQGLPPSQNDRLQTLVH